MFDSNNMELRNEVISFLSNNQILVSFEYDPYGESTIECEPKVFSSFFLDAFVDYCIQSGDPISGAFIVKTFEDRILVNSVSSVAIDRSFAEPLSQDEKDELTFLISDLFSLANEEWYYNIEFSLSNGDYDTDIGVFMFDDKENDYVSLDTITEEQTETIQQFLIDNFSNQEDRFELFLTNSEDPESWIEYTEVEFEL
jgi:hypothetical protein